MTEFSFLGELTLEGYRCIIKLVKIFNNQTPNEQVIFTNDEWKSVKLWSEFRRCKPGLWMCDAHLRRPRLWEWVRGTCRRTACVPGSSLTCWRGRARGVRGERAARALQAAVGRRVNPSVRQRGQAPQRWHGRVGGACVSHVVQIVVRGGARQRA